MSNQVEVVRTEFKALKSGDTEQGYRIFDAYGASYRMYNKESHEKVPDDDGDLLRDIQEATDDVISGLIEYAIEHGIVIDGQFYDANWVDSILNSKHLFSPETDLCIYCGISAEDDRIENNPCPHVKKEN